MAVAVAVVILILLSGAHHPLAHTLISSMGLPDAN